MVGAEADLKPDSLLVSISWVRWLESLAVSIASTIDVTLALKSFRETTVGHEMSRRLDCYRTDKRLECNNARTASPHSSGALISGYNHRPLTATEQHWTNTKSAQWPLTETGRLCDCEVATGVVVLTVLAFNRC